MWAAWRDYGRTQDYFTTELPITYEPIGQVNLFWHHKISADGADTWLWLGVPAQTRINQAFSGVLTDFTFGTSVQAPISDSLALAGTFQYAKAAASQGVLGSLEDSFDLSVSLVFYPGPMRQEQNRGRKSLDAAPASGKQRQLHGGSEFVRNRVWGLVVYGNQFSNP